VNLFWPGIIIGILLMIICTVGYTKRSSLGGGVDTSISTILGKKRTKDTKDRQEATATHLVVPLLGGIAMGAAILIFSVTGVMR
jgi:ABC-type spermidine/putrescine transport system permease subunit I